MVLHLKWASSLFRAENERSEVGDDTGYVKFNLNSLWSSPSDILVTGVLFSVLQTVQNVRGLSLHNFLLGGVGWGSAAPLLHIH